LALLSAKTSALSTTAAVVDTGCLSGEEEPALEIACLFTDCYYYFANFSCCYSYLLILLAIVVIIIYCYY
jgi:hypothetical protein